MIKLKYNKSTHLKINGKNRFLLHGHQRPIIRRRFFSNSTENKEVKSTDITEIAKASFEPSIEKRVGIFAWTLQNVSKGIESGSVFIGGTIETTGSIAGSVIQGTGMVVKTVLEPVRIDIPLPDIVHDATATIGQVAKVSKTVVKEALHTTTKLGMVVGEMTIDITKTAVTAVVGEKNIEESETIDAMKNLASTTFRSYASITESISSAGDHVIKTTGDSAADVIHYQLGEGLGKVAREGISIGRDIFETVDSVHNTTVSKISKDLAKAVGKGALNSLRENDNVNDNENPNKK